MRIALSKRRQGEIHISCGLHDTCRVDVRGKNGRSRLVVPGERKEGRKEGEEHRRSMIFCGSAGRSFSSAANSQIPQERFYSVYE